MKTHKPKFRSLLLVSLTGIFMYFLTGCGGAAKQDAGREEKSSSDSIRMDTVKVSDTAKPDTMVHATPPADTTASVSKSDEGKKEPPVRNPKIVHGSPPRHTMKSNSIVCEQRFTISDREGPFTGSSMST